jgi:hypothetical protein
MWRGYEKALMLYYNAIVQEWIRRGFKNTMELYEVKEKVAMPWFVNNKSIRMSHRASLIRKYEAYYSPIFKDVPCEYMEYKYIWPSKLTQDKIEYLKKNQNVLVDISEFAERV